MANRITQSEREQLIARAAQLLRDGVGRRTAEAQIVEETGISLQRARSAVAHAAMRMRK